MPERTRRCPEPTLVELSSRRHAPGWATSPALLLQPRSRAKEKASPRTADRPTTRPRVRERSSHDTGWSRGGSCSDASPPARVLALNTASRSLPRSTGGANRSISDSAPRSPNQRRRRSMHNPGPATDTSIAPDDRRPKSLSSSKARTRCAPVSTRPARMVDLDHWGTVLGDERACRVRSGAGMSEGPDWRAVAPTLCRRGRFSSGPWPAASVAGRCECRRVRTGTGCCWVTQ